MKKRRIGINGFGRIGRLSFRAAWDWPEFDWALIYPELKGKLNGHAVRVPLLNASLTDCVFNVQRETTVDEVNALLRAAAESGSLKDILGYEERPLVSIDYQGDPRSSIIDALSTMVVDGKVVKIYAWYDNEWGYANRMVELGRKVATLL